MSVINEAVRLQRQERQIPPSFSTPKVQKALGESKVRLALGDLSSKEEWLKRLKRLKCDWPCLRKFAKSAYTKLGVKHLIPSFFILLYTIAGGGLFMSLERGPDQDHRQSVAIQLDAIRAHTIQKIRDIADSVRISGWNISELEIMTAEAVTAFERDKDDITGMSFSEDTVWDFWTSMYFCGTLYTTIGYGNIACSTAAGQVITIIYALVGIPLVLTTLNDLGIFLFNTIYKACQMLDYIKKGRCIPKKWRDWISEKRGQSWRHRRPPLKKTWSIDLSFDSGDIDIETGEKQRSESELDIEEREKEMEETAKRVPVSAALIVTFGFIFGCAAIFCIWETEWDYFTSVYFFIISLSTIGLGDVVPDHPKLMIIMFPLVIVGLSLVSMCISVVQGKLEDLYFALLLKLLEEYQRRLSEGKGEVDATMGMMDAFASNRASKLLKLLPKNKMNDVMDKFQEEAKAQGLEVPSILQHMDRNTGLPSVLTVPLKEDAEEDDEFQDKIKEALSKAEEVVQHASSLQDVAPSPLVITYEEDTQTDIMYMDERSSQTTVVHTEDSGIQSLLSCFYSFEDVPCQTVPPELLDVEAQTEDDTKEEEEELEEECQTPDFHDGIDVETQTTAAATAEIELQTHLYDLREEEAQTIIVQLLETEAQTEQVQCKEQELQTHLYDVIEGDAQTDPPPGTFDKDQQTPIKQVDEQEAQTEEPYPDITKSKSNLGKLKAAFRKKKKGGLTSSDEDTEAKSLKSRLERMGKIDKSVSDTDIETEEDGGEAEEEERSSEESLQWDPVDGMHAEPQRPVTDLKKMFETGTTLDIRRTPSPPPAKRKHGRVHSLRSGSKPHAFEE